MKNDRQMMTTAGISVISFLLVGLLVLIGLNTPLVQAKAGALEPVEAGEALVGPAAESAPSLPRTITVVGEGKITIKPDIAQTNIGVEVVASSVREASTETASIMKAVLAALKAQGVADGDIQTSGYNVWVERPYGPDGPQPDKVLYHTGNNVQVTVRDLDKLAAILDAAIEAGANNIYGVTFSLADPDRVMADGRGKAIKDARAKAEALAQMNQVKLGEVVSVSEIIGGDRGYYPNSASRGLGGGDGLGGGGPISAGELGLTIQLQVTYALQ